VLSFKHLFLTDTDQGLQWQDRSIYQRKYRNDHTVLLSWCVQTDEGSNTRVSFSISKGFNTGRETQSN